MMFESFKAYTTSQVESSSSMLVVRCVAEAIKNVQKRGISVISWRIWVGFKVLSSAWRQVTENKRISSDVIRPEVVF